MITTYPVIINGVEHMYGRLTILLPRIDLLSWLDSQSLFPKFYWKGEDEFAALGAICHFDHAPVIEGDSMGHLRFFGGTSFTQEKRKDALWADFPDASFFLPSYELKQEKDFTQLTLHFLDATPSDEGLRHLQFTESKVSHLSLQLDERKDLPLFSEWEKILKLALENAAFKKVVLARRSSFRLETPCSPFSLLAKMSAKAVYAFQPARTSAFIGATPERLYLRDERAIISDVIAGTFTCKNEAKDPKLQREFLIVKEAIMAALRPLCSSLAHEKEDFLIDAHAMHHLCNRISGILRPEITDAKLIAALHPTPAIGGYPQKNACKFIQDHEPFDRGWYSAPIGWLSEPKAEFGVAIRSALVQENAMHLFAGAGIVEGSKADKEWEELELKISQYL